MPRSSSHGSPFPITIIPHADSGVLCKAGYDAIYIIGFDGQPDDAPLKVGIASDIHVRLHGMQTGNWQKIVVHEILFVQRHDNGDRGFAVAPRIEAEIHEILRAKGLHRQGEWFAGGSNLIIEIAKEVATRQSAAGFLTCASMLRRMKMWKIEADEASAKGIKPATSRAETYSRAVLDKAMIRSKQSGFGRIR